MGKNYNAAIAKVDTNKFYNIDDAVKLLPETATAKFDETVDVAVRLGIDPKQSEQMVRGTVVLPNGTGKKVRVLVFAKGEKEKEAKDAGADFVGGDDLIEKVSKGWLDVDRAVKEVKAGKIEFKVDKSGNMHVPIGKVSFGVNKLKENLTALLETVVKAKPSTSKGTYLKSITISTTMGPGIKIDAVGVRELFK